MKHIAFIVTTPLTINSFMIEHIKLLSVHYKVTVIANKKIDLINDSLPINFIDLPLERNISLFRDFLCVFKLWKIIASNDFDVVHSITPKAGLIGMLSAFLGKVEHRFHFFTGQVWVTKKGVLRKLLKYIDRLIFKLSTFSLVDSKSQRDFLLKEKIINSDKTLVLGSGSISGVDISKFYYSDDVKIKIRKKYNLPEDAFIFVFVGRLCKDKGIDELIKAYEIIAEKNESTYLLLVGPNEGEYNTDFFKKINNNKIIVTGLTRNTELYFCASDVFVLPSHREGFGTTILEAAACGIPSIASNIYGLSDAVEHGETGLLHKVKDVTSLASCMQKLLNNRDLTSKLGEQALNRVRKHYTSEYLSLELLKFYKANVDDKKNI